MSGLAAAELVATSRGHATPDFPADLAPYVMRLMPPTDELKESACDAVSAVLQRSELMELWADSGDAEEWSRMVQWWRFEV